MRSSALFQEKDIKEAYLKLKSCIYYDKNYFYKNDLANFEYENDLNAKFSELAEILNSDAFKLKINKYIDKIDFYILPKTLKQELIEKDRNIVSNSIIKEEYIVNKINYFIRLPIELQIIDVLWCIKAGRKLQKEVNSEDAYANILDIDSREQFRSKNLFKKYYNQYSIWRDNSIRKAEELYNNGRNCIIFSLDIEKYYYNINVDYEKLNVYPDSPVMSNLLDILKLIHLTYRTKTKAVIDEVYSKNAFLPIGLQSSGIIANWYLTKFDTFVKNQLKPSYYGRYVDDILCVFENNTNIKDSNELIQHFFNKNELFDFKDNSYEFAIEELKSLKIQKDKIKIFLIDSSSSKTILERFKKDIQANSSEFRFLPSFKNIDKEFSSKMFNLNYDGSSNIIRNIDKFILNRYNTSVYLSKKIKLAFYVQESNEKYVDHFLNILNKEIKGRYTIELYDYWFKIFEYLLIKGYKTEFKDLYKLIKNKYITKIKYEDKYKAREELISGKLKSNLQEYLFFAASLAFSLNPDKDFKFIHYNQRLIDTVKKYRKSNLIDNNRIFIPLYNYTKQYRDNTKNAKKLNDFRNLLEYKYDDLTFENFKLDKNYLKLGPVNIYQSKQELFEIYKAIIFGKCNQIETYSKIRGKTIKPEKYSCYNGDINIFNFDIPLNEEDINKKNIKFGIANYSIKATEAKKIGKTDLSDEKFEKIRNLLEYAQLKKCDVVVFPEITIPFQWLSLFYEETKIKQIGIIGGLQHFINKENCCYNTLCTILPYKYNNKYRDAFVRLRVKNNYSPEEKKIIEENGHKIPSSDIRNYDLFSWKNTYFSSYNCFEISSLEDRSLFKGKIDFITLNAYNRDTTYFTNIINSTSRDLHCCVVHVNNSEFGYSCVSLPKETYESMPVIVKGGEDDLVITYDFNYLNLRTFQQEYLNNTLTEKIIKKPVKLYKDLPPNFIISDGRKNL